MRQDARLSGALHALLHMAEQGRPMTSEELGHCMSTNPVVVRRTMAGLREAGFVRFRPVLMTALAMIIGMLPMALGLGEGGEQNAPLGRAVIGGLLFSTVATLVFVPVVFSIVHGRRARKIAAAGPQPQSGVPVHAN